MKQKIQVGDVVKIKKGFLGISGIPTSSPESTYVVEDIMDITIVTSTVVAAVLRGISTVIPLGALELAEPYIRKRVL